MKRNKRKTQTNHSEQVKRELKENKEKKIQRLVKGSNLPPRLLRSEKPKLSNFP